MVGVSIVCPVCGLVYGGARVLIDMVGIDVADEIDAAFGSDYGAAGAFDWIMDQF